MIVNNIENSQIVSWPSPYEKDYKQMFVCGSKNQIQIRKMAMGQTHSILLGETSFDFEISKIVWSIFNQKGQYKQGLILVGTIDGSILIFDAHMLITGNSHQQNVLVALEQGLFEGVIESMEVNPFKPNLIAIGGDREVLIFNLEGNIKDPQIFSPGLPNLHDQNQGNVISVCWNKKLAHILASADIFGLTVVWDLKTNKPLFNFQNQQSQNEVQVSLVWSPEIPTQICVGYSDQQETQIWDLRQPQGPVVQFDNSSEVLCVDWCSQDSNLILLGHQNSTVSIWNYKQAVKLGQIQIQDIPYGCKFSSAVNGIFSIDHQEQSYIYYLKPSHIDGYLFQWTKRNFGIALSNNAKMVMFQNGNIKEFKALPQQDDIYDQLVDFENLFNENDHKKIIENLTDDDFYKYLNAKQKGVDQLLEVLGFNKKEILNQTEIITGKSYGQLQEEKKPQKKQTQKFNFGTMNDQDAENFFDQLGAQQKKPEPTLIQKPIKTAENEIIQTEQIQKNTNWKAGTESAIRKNLLIGNYEGAVDCAIKCGRMTEAFLIAQSKDQTLIQNVMDSWFASQQDPFIRNFFKNFILAKSDDFGKNTNLDNWLEVISCALTDQQQKQQSINIINQLGDRFLKEKKDLEKAQICYLLADNFNGLIKIFYQQIKSQNCQVIKVVQKILLLDGVRKQSQISQETQQLLDDIFIDFGQIAMSYQRNIIAYKILDQAQQNNRNVQLMKEQLYNQNLDPQFFIKYPNPPQTQIKIVNFKVQQQKRMPTQNRNQPKQIFQQEETNQPPIKQNQFIKNNQESQQQKTAFSKTAPFRPQQNVVQPPPSISRPPAQEEQQNQSQNQSLNQSLNEPKKQFNPNNFQQNRPQQVKQQPPMRPQPQPQQKEQVQPQAQPQIQQRPPMQPFMQPQNSQKIQSQHQSMPPSNIQQPPQQQQQQQQQPQQQPQQQSQPQQQQQQNQSIVKYQGPSDQISYINDCIQKQKSVIQKIENNLKKRNDLESQLDQLCQLIQYGQIKQTTFENLVKICQSLEQGKNQEALGIYTIISKDDWETNKSWLMTLKRVLMKR